MAHPVKPGIVPDEAHPPEAAARAGQSGARARLVSTPVRSRHDARTPGRGLPGDPRARERSSWTPPCLPPPSPSVPPTPSARRRARRASPATPPGLAFGSLFTQAAQILTLSVLARLVAKDEIATYQQMNLVYGVLSPLLLAGIPAALLYFVPRAALPEERHAWMVRAYVVLGCHRPRRLAHRGGGAGRPRIAVQQPGAGERAGLVCAVPLLRLRRRRRSARARRERACPFSAALLNALRRSVDDGLRRPCGAHEARPATGLAEALSVSGAILAVASVLIVRRTDGRSARERPRAAAGEGARSSPTAYRWP